MRSVIVVAGIVKKREDRPRKSAATYGQPCRVETPGPVARCIWRVHTRRDYIPRTVGKGIAVCKGFAVIANRSAWTAKFRQIKYLQDVKNWYTRQKRNPRKARKHLGQMRQEFSSSGRIPSPRTLF